MTILLLQSGPGKAGAAGGGGGGGDPSFSNVKLLMGFNGANNATSGPGFTDESSAAHGAATRFGNAKIDNTQSVFGGTSLNLDGLSRISFADSGDWDFSNQPFTIECRVRVTGVSGLQVIVAQWDANVAFLLYLNGATLNFQFATGSGGTGATTITGGTIAANTWYTVCIDFNGTKYRLYLDGVMIASSTAAGTIFNAPENLAIGANSAGGFVLTGWIDELRITKGVARYASDSGYTIATVEFPRS